ncbi:cytochrome c biogenesis protein ResB [Streptomyces noursei]|uniref:cytochrome c biogenesis protein ResB n=1 Tax=Streptomyces noursei TaxID=1971 RepID=UPI0030F10195
MSTTTNSSSSQGGGSSGTGDAGAVPGATGHRSSAARKEDVSLPSLGPVGWARWFWRQLTSMRVALMLLFLLSLGAVPGSLIPQASTDPVKVDEFKTAHATLGEIYDKLGMFHVYSSVWFSAVYLLLFVSLIGCIVPRAWQFVEQFRRCTPAAPRRMTRLPAYTTWRTDAHPDDVLAAAERMLKGRCFRARRDGSAVAAEKGYLREAGNLVFHLALVVILVAIAVGSLGKSEGGKLILEGDGFGNSRAQYDDFDSGAFFDTGSMKPFGFTLHKFLAVYERSGPQKGTPRVFRADISYFLGAGGTEHKASIEVNEPLDIADSKVYLISHGYAPTVTVKDGRGKVVYRGSVPFLPQDAKNFTSTGVVKVPGAKAKDGRPNQLGFQGFFIPTYGGTGSGTMFSQFPALDNPRMVLTAFHGDLGLGSGLPQNVYQLKMKGLTQYKAHGRAVAQMLRPGETMTLPGGDGSITFDGVKPWAGFQISHKPGNGLALIGGLAALFGVAGSLLIQRRRVWVGAERGNDGVTVVEIGGLGRSDAARIPQELADLARKLEPDAPIASATASRTAPAHDTDARSGPHPGRRTETRSRPTPSPGPTSSQDPAQPTDRM